MENTTVRRLMKYLDASPSCYHATENLKKRLLDSGYQLLRESEVWKLQHGGKYVVIRNDSSLIAFRIPAEVTGGFMMAAAHSDFPALKLREATETESGGTLVLTTEPYGGMIFSSWMDRPLSVAGRVMTDEDGCLRTRLVNVDRDLLVIPNVAPHMNRSINDGAALKPNVDLRPVMGTADDKGKLRAMVAEAADVKEEDILSSELFLYPRIRGTLVGAEEQYILSPRLDDLQCAFTCTEGFLRAAESRSIPVLCVFNNEEVGSGTLQGANSDFLGNVLKRISQAMGRTEEAHLAALAESFMVSADNAHAVHPNHPEYADVNEKVTINGGVAVKFNANQKYSTDAVSAAVFRRICRMADAPVQSYSNRADMPGGSTLGNISITRVSVPTVDVGLPQLAMHSACELAGVEDTEHMARIMEIYFSCTLRRAADGGILL
ncbi:MAG: M18 family aminopeptidase [Ruminococcaceae bacterium]|nr:M18 family aminopeptidase [Oscillospiraceae bacterium]